jgi:hypothetical protein
VTTSPAEPFRGVDVDQLRAVVAWLDSDQAEDAVVSHHGVAAKVGEFRVTVCPQAPDRNNRQPKRRGCVVVFEVRPDAYKRDTAANLTNGIDEHAKRRLCELLEEVVPVIGEWNGLGRECVTVSFNIDREPGSGVSRARANYVPFERTGPAVTGIDLPAA